VSKTAAEPGFRFNENGGLPGPLTNQRINAMNRATIGRDRIEEEILNHAVSDDALEAAAGIGKGKAVPNTVPFALICIPFSPQSRSQSGVAASPDPGE
jgi:hypothetical protein